MPSPLERIECVRGDLTRETTDAVVNAANERLEPGGGVAGALHRAAGPGLVAECRARHPGGCPTGEARVTGGHDLPARIVVHTVGPRWRGGGAGEPAALAACFHASLAAAAAEGARSIAFPAISTGIFGYPPAEAARTSLAALAAGLAAQPAIERVRIVLFDEPLRALFAAELGRQRAAAAGGQA